MRKDPENTHERARTSVSGTRWLWLYHTHTHTHIQVLINPKRKRHPLQSSIPKQLLHRWSHARTLTPPTDPPAVRMTWAKHLQNPVGYLTTATERKLAANVNSFPWQRRAFRQGTECVPSEYRQPQNQRETGNQTFWLPDPCSVTHAGRCCLSAGCACFTRCRLWHQQPPNSKTQTRSMCQGGNFKMSNRFTLHGKMTSHPAGNLHLQSTHAHSHVQDPYCSPTHAAHTVNFFFSGDLFQ